MTWLDEEWDAFACLLEHGWPGAFGEGADLAYRTLLADVAPVDAVLALKRLVARGGTFRPSVSEIATEVAADPGSTDLGRGVPAAVRKSRLSHSAPRGRGDRARRRAASAAGRLHRPAGLRAPRDAARPRPGPRRARATRPRTGVDALEERAAERQAAGLALDEIGRPRRLGPSRPDYLRALPTPEAAA